MSEGKTVDEAIEKALVKLQVTKDKVDIEILQQPTTGLFGRRIGTAVVKVTVKKESTSESRHFGLVAIVNGKLSYTAPPLQGVAPRIQFGSDLHVVYHGKQREKEVELSHGLESLEIILPENGEPELIYEIGVNPTKTKAELFWKSNPGVTYNLADQPPRNQLRLSVSRTTVDPQVLTLQNVEHLVQIEGLKYGLMLGDLTPEMLRTPGGSVVIAQGFEPEPGQNGTVQYVFQEEAPAVDRDAMRIDHYEVHGTQGVQIGAVLAVKNPSKPGKPGMDVYGNSLPAPPIHDENIQVGEGVILSQDGLQAIAVMAGLASLHSGVVRITKVFELPGDADVSTGNITMDTDIIIKGSVMENVKVESGSGVIVVNGLVSGATLRTGGSITVLRNVVRSQLFAGGASVTQIRILNMLKQIRDQFEGLIVAYEAIVAQAENIPFENLIKHLIELKFFSLPKHIKDLVDYVSQINGEDSKEYQAIKDGLASCLLTNGPLRITDIEHLRQMYDSVKKRILDLENVSTVEANIKVGYLQNSRVEASGKVEITGQGCFYSTVLAGTGFKITNGVFRGGEVVANSGTIEAKELGGPTGIATKAHLLGTGRVTANLVHPNVLIVIGPQSYKFDETRSQVKAFFHEGLLTIYSGANKIHG